MTRTFLARLSLCLLLAACAPAGNIKPPGKPADPPKAATPHGEMASWRLDEVAESTQPAILLRAPSGMGFRLDAERVRNIQSIARRVVDAAGAGETPEWLLTGTLSINAFATYRNGQPTIGITLGMVGLLGDDEGAWAALLGHELAHFRLGHHQSRRVRRDVLDVGSSLAGVLLSVAGLGIGSLAADATGTLVERSFSRDDERDADSRGLEYARRAGFDPYGAVRLQQRLMESKRDNSLSLLSTHPSGQDRVDTIRRLIEEDSPRR
jgi:predicted Zn-dependent protease